MKKILYIFLLSGLLSSCDDLLDVEPETLLSFDNYFKTELDLESTLYSIQGFINDKLLAHATQEEAGEFRDYEAYESVSSIRLWNTEAITKSIGSDWSNIYGIVYMANVMLDNISKAEVQVSPDRIQFYKAQAYFAKGLSYYILGMKWGEVPITRNSTSAEPYGKKPVLEVLDTAISNATRAYKVLPVQSEVKDRLGNVIKSKQFGSKGSACALLANLYAWKGSIIDLQGLEGDAKDCYMKAIQYCSELIEGNEVGSYRLVRDPERLCELFSDINQENPEAIFEFTVDMQSKYVSSPYLFASAYLNIDGKGTDAKVAQTTIDKLYESQDKRVSSFVTPGVNMWGEPDGYATLNKWRTGVWAQSDPNNPYSKTMTAVSTNFAYWRLSGIYLLRAECNAKLDAQSSEAIGDLNEIRGIAGATLYPNGPGDDMGLQYAVFKERQRELYIEGHRWYDIVRNGMWYINNELYQGDDGKFKTMTLEDVRKGAIFLPIFDSAFTMNSLLVQNQYWLEALNQ